MIRIFKILPGEEGEQEGVGEMSQNGKAPNNLANEAQSNFISEWVGVGKQILRPLVIIPLLITVLALYVANQEAVNKSLSIILNIIAAVSSAFAGRFFYDYLKGTMGNIILMKKGDSAVRHLFLVKLQIKNISERVKRKASTEEIGIALSFLEKLIINSIQEWNDIIPGIIKKEAVYESLAEKENELENAHKEKEKLNEQLIKEKELNKEEKEKVGKEIKKWEGKISELSREIDSLKTASGAKRLAEVFNRELSPLGNVLSQFGPALTGPALTGWPRALTTRKCENCGALYFSSDAAVTLCEDCRAKLKKPG
jgi:rRNA maturation endonuclease Nob1